MMSQTGVFLSVKGLSVKVRFLLAIISLILVTGCISRPVKSLCIMDFQDQMCWVDKENHQGFSFPEMWEQQSRCQTHEQIPCWYGIDSADLTRIMDSLD